MGAQSALVRLQDFGQFPGAGQQKDGVFGQPVFQTGGVRVEVTGKNAFPARVHGPVQGIQGVFVQATGLGLAFVEGFGLRPQRLVHNHRGNGQNLDFFHPGNGTLGDRVETAHVLERVAEELQAQGRGIARRKNVENVAAHGNLTRPAHERRAPIAPIHGLIQDHIRGHFHAFIKAQIVAVEDFHGRQAHEQVVGGDDNQPARQAHPQGIQGGGAFGPAAFAAPLGRMPG